MFYLEAQNAVNRNSAPPQGILVNQFIYLLPMKSLRLWSPHLPHHLNNLIRRGFIKVYGTVLNWYFQPFYLFAYRDSTGYFVWFSKRISLLTEPFVEFFRYLPAPAFGALAVAILGINDAPKIAIIVIGTLFQQILIIANTTRTVDRSLIEAGYTLGTNKLKSLFHVVIPAALPDIYRDLRVLLGWAWTYLIVSELIGTTSGITWFITPTGTLSKL